MALQLSLTVSGNLSLSYCSVLIRTGFSLTLSYYFECTQCNKSDRPEITITTQTQDSCCPLSLANTAQRTLSASGEVIKEEVVEAHFLYYSLLNLGFLKRHLKA